MEGERRYFREPNNAANERQTPTPEGKPEIKTAGVETPGGSLAEQVSEFLQDEKAAKQLQIGQEIFTGLENRYIQEAQTKYLELGFGKTDVKTIFATLEKPHGHNEVMNLYQQRGGKDWYGLNKAFQLYLTADDHRRSKSYREKVISGQLDEFKRVGSPEAKGKYPVEYIQKQCRKTITDFATALYLESQFQLAMDTEIGRLVRKVGRSGADVGKALGKEIGDVGGDAYREISAWVQRTKWKLEGW